MTVYVDDMRAPFGRLIMCHMVADSSDELMEMARKIGVHTRWLQKKGTPQEHFDICMTKRELAVKAGAHEVTMKQVAELCRAKRLSSRQAV